jgi:hypothetical protein
MGAVSTGKRKLREKETSLEPYYHYHYCFECGRFRREWFDTDGFSKNYCLKWCRKVRPDNEAYWCFTFPLIRKGRVSKEERNYDCVAWKMADTFWFMGRVVNVPVKKPRCQRCGREFTAQASNPKNTPLYCSNRCRYWSRRFRKKTEKNRRMSLANYIVLHWKERAFSLVKRDVS